MKLVGIQKLTLLDYPGRVACTVFLDGCNFRCPFCHNSQLLTGAEPVMTEEDLLFFLHRRSGILDGVCITGGEPTIHPELPALLRKIKELGYSIKLDTNGYCPEVLHSVLEERLADYVAMDLKNSPACYGPTVGFADPDLAKIRQSIRLLLKGNADYELRTTVVKPMHSAQTIADMGSWLLNMGDGQKVKQIFLQPFVDRDTVPMSGLSAPTAEELELFSSILASCAEHVGVRGT